MKNRVLLTGACGFVGSHVLRHLYLNTDWDIVCPVTFKYKGLQDRIRLAVQDLDNPFKRIKIIHCDLSSPISTITAKEFGEIDYVFNLASESHVDRSILEPANFIINNVSISCHLLDWARNQTNLKKFIQVSTDEVYGPANGNHLHTEWKDLHIPSNPYSASKAAQEDIAIAYWRTYNIPLMITNTMNIVGEMQDPEKFVPMVIKNILNNESVPIHASKEGEVGSRFYLHARNKADALLFLINENFPLYGETSMPIKYNVVGEKEINNLDMAKMIANILDKPLKYHLVDFHSSRPGHDLRYALNGKKLFDLGWKPPLSFEKSLEKTVLWTANNSEWVLA